MKKGFFVLAALTLFSQMSLADQCQWITTAQAQKAAQIISSRGGGVSVRCDLCGDQIAQFISGGTVSLESDSPTESTVVVTDSSGKKQELDLAYSFVSNASGTLDNLADLVGCPYTP
jgi:hypothetical protein